MTDMVSVPVPVDRLQEVYELLAKRPAAPPFAQETEDGYPYGWSRALIDRMFVESSSAMRRILCSVAEKSPGWITTGQIAEASDLTARQVVASLGPFEKRVRGRYKMSEWPFAARQFVDEGILKYSMSPAVAAVILELAVEMETQENESV
jgi:hypothetical protein